MLHCLCFHIIQKLVPSFLQVISREDLRSVHGPSQSGHRGEDEMSVLPIRLLGHKCCQVSKPTIWTSVNKKTF